MACILIYKNNQPIGVEDAEGNPSKLFEQILSNPQINSFEEALSIYQNIYSDKIKLEDVQRQVGVAEAPADEAITEVLDKLIETDLAKNVYFLSNEDIQTALSRLGEDVDMITAGFIHDGNVYINKDHATNDTAIHEFNHLYTGWLKANRPEVYNKGLELVIENKDGVLDEIIASVKETQPFLEEGTEAFYEEVLTEAVGQKGAKILAEKVGSPFANWLQEAWDAIKSMLGLSQFSTEEVMNMSVEDFIEASAVDLLSGKVLPVVNNTTNSRPIEPFTESYPLSFVQPSDVIDFKALLADIQAKGQKVWFWMGDQLGRGSYVDSVTGEEHFMDAGLSYALDPINRNRGAIWASGLTPKTLQGKTDEADYIFIISGSPTHSKLFNNNVQKLYTDRIGDFNKFKEDVLAVSKKKDINEFLEGKNSWEDFKKAEMKNFIIALRGQEKLKGTPLKSVLNDYRVFLDINELRDGFLVANDFKANDVMLVLKPQSVGGKSSHSTYEIELMGEVVGVPDIIVNSYDIIDEKAKEKYIGKKELVSSQQTKVVAAEIGKIHKIGTNVKFQKKEPSLIYKDSKGDVHTSVQDALKNTPEGNISMGIDTLEGYKELASIDANSNVGTKEGILNNLIKANLLSGESFIDSDGKKVHKVAGHNVARRVINSQAVVSSIRQQLGIKAAKALSNGDIVFDDNHTKRQVMVTKKDGSNEFITPEDLSAKSFKEIKRDYDDAVAIVTLRDYKEAVSIYGEQLEETQPFMPENELQLKLMNVLKSMGVKTTSIADYVSKYGAKNGVDPSAQALADLANNVIAFKDGVVDAEDLLEETAHFIIASTPEAEKADMKRNIHKTPEWVEHQASYREIYGQTYSGEELEDIVREEILGKVLKNAVKDKFKAETETQQNFYNKVLEFFKNFFTRVETYFKEDSQRQLDTFTSAVYNNLMNDTLNGILSGENNSHYVLYSTTNNTNGQVSQIYKQTEELLTRLTQQQAELSKKYNSPGSRSLLGTAKKQMENLEGEVEEVARLKALANLAMVANSQADILTRVIDKNLKTGYHFSQEENSVYQNFIHKIEPLLNQIDVQLNPNSIQEKKIQADIKATLGKIGKLRGQSKEINDKALDSILDRIIKKNSFTDAEATKYRDSIKDILAVAQKDTQFLHANLGSLTNAKNGFLNLAGDVIERVQNTERGLYIPKIKGFLNSLDKLGFDSRNLKKFIRDGYIINEVDAKKEKEADLEDKVASYNFKHSTLAPATVDDVEQKIKEIDDEIKALENSKADKQRLTDLKGFRQTYDKNYKLKKRERFESYFSEDYLKELNRAFVTTDNGVFRKEDIQKAAIEADKFYRSQVIEIRMNAEDGILTAADADAIKDVNRQRLDDSSARDSEGKLKKGLREYWDNTQNKYLVELDYTIPMSDSELNEAEKVHGLQMLAMINQEFYKSQPNLNGIPNKFRDAMNALGSEKEKWEFVQYNAFLGFEDSFWEGFGTGETLIDKLRDEGHDDLIEEIRNQQQVISNILKKNRVFNNPSETDANEMNQIDRDSIKNAQSILENKYSTARGLVKETEEQNRAQIQADSVTNEAYKQRLEDDVIDTLDKELDFILGHVTSSNVAYIDTAKKIAAKLKNGEDVKLNKTFSKVFDESMTEDEVNAALLTYAKSKLLPYYKRTEPIGYSEKLAQLKQDIENNVPGTVASVVEGTAPISSDLKVSPSFSFFESTDGVNKVWLANKAAKRTQYSKEWLKRVENDEYYSMFGIDKNTRERVGNTNQKDWEAREELLKLQDWSLENYRITGVHNRYLLPQLQKSAIERGVKGIKKSMADLVGFRQDELEYGQDINGDMSKKGSTLLTIPTYGVNKIQDQEDVSHQLLESYAFMAQQSALHRARRENIGDMLVLNDLISNTSYENKEASATNTYKMFKSYMDANFYGVKESFTYETTVLGKRVDLAKVAHTFNSYVKTSALAGITVPMTSLVTGRVAGFVEKMVGEVVNPMAYRKAHIEFLKHSTAAAAEIGGFTSHAKLNVVLEAIGVYNTNERFQNSNYNRALRTGLKASSGLNELGNFPVSAPMGLSVIYDYKYHGSDIITFDQYKNANPTKDVKTIKEDWEKLDQFYDDWIVKDGVLEFNKVKMAQKLNLSMEELDELIELKMEAISAKAASLLARTDARVPLHQRSIAARDARANFLLTFLNYFTINLQLKLKDRHYNISEQRYQEGNWMTVKKLVSDLLMNPKDMKSVWNEALADEITKTNLKRTAIELGVANALAIAAILLANFADDEEDPSFLLQYSSFLLDRMAVEQTGSTIGLPNQFGDILENPILAAQKVKDLKDIGDVFSGELVGKGAAYQNESERMKFFRKNIPFIKDYARMKDAKRARATYEHFNYNTLNNWAWGSYIFDEEERIR